jgi:hypothetical protein
MHKDFKKYHAGIKCMEECFKYGYLYLALLLFQSLRLFLLGLGIKLLIMRHDRIHIPWSLTCRYIVRASRVEDPETRLATSLYM